MRTFDVNPHKEQFFLKLVRDGLIDVRKDGTVWNKQTGRSIGYPVRKGRGGLVVGWKAGKVLHKCKVNRLVWLVHVGSIPEGLTPKYKDGNPCNPALENLKLDLLYSRALLSPVLQKVHGKKYGIISRASDEEFKVLVASSMNVSDVLRKFDLPTSGNSWTRVQKRIRDLGISIDHFETPKVGKIVRYAPEKVLISNSPYSTSAAKTALKQFKSIAYKCRGFDGFECKVTNEWGGKPLSLHLDHIDGDNRNHLPSNLRWLCPNCHSQTPTFAGRNTLNPNRRKT